jgi:low molecular weight phosphotyrosine protein phosphatase
MLFGEFSGKKKAEEVDDPYYGGRAYEQCVRFSENFLKQTFPDVKS